MNASQGRGWDLRAALIAIGALAGVVFVLTQLTGSDAETEIAKVGYTAYAVVVFTVLGSVGVGLARIRPRFALLGVITTILSLLAFGALVVSLWKSGSIFNLGIGGSATKVLAVTALLAITAAAASALLLMTRRDEGGALLVAIAGAGSIAVFAGLWILTIVDSGVDIGSRTYAIVAVVYVVAAVLLFLLLLLPSDERPPRPTGSVAGVDHIVIAVSDRAKADWFYRDVLGAEVVPGADGRVAYRFGSQRLNVHEPGTVASPLAAIPVQPGNSDICLAWSGSPESALEHLRQSGVEATGPLLRAGARGEGASIYCRDPDGSLIELISYSSQRQLS
jgi:catechol 2,3-dioxygenase-like lactoylglutathione lyase family enzyme